MSEEFTKNVQKKEKPLRRILEIAFDRIEKNGDSYDFFASGSFICTIRREVLNEKQISLFNSLSEFKT